MFDLPHPFGPTTTAIPVPDTVSSVRSQKLLKPRIWIFFSFSMSTPAVVVARPGPRRAGGVVPITTDSTEQKRQGQRTSQQFLWIRSPQFIFMKFTWFHPGFFGFSTLVYAGICTGPKVTFRILFRAPQ